jgi:hypothetical protein
MSECGACLYGGRTCRNCILLAWQDTARERDEARAVARRLLRHFQEDNYVGLDALIRENPWLCEVEAEASAALAKEGRDG